MKLLIDVPKEQYEAYKGKPPRLGDEGIDSICQAIGNGVPFSDVKDHVTNLIYSVPYEDWHNAYNLAIEHAIDRLEEFEGSEEK